MSLRIRLIVAFFLLSVVPLAAVTFYSYTSNVRALSTAAQHETEMLTNELTQRMQVVTTQISERVEHLMDMPVATADATGTSGQRPPAARTASSPTASAPTASARSTKSARTASAPTASAPTTSAPTTAAAPPRAPGVPAAPAPPTAVATAIDARTIEGQVAGALGEVAMLLNNVEVRGLGRGRFGGQQGAPGATGRGGVQSLAAADAALRAGFPAGTLLPGPPPAAGARGPGDAARGGGPSLAPGSSPADAGGREGERRRGGRGFPPDGSRPDRPPVPPGTPAGDRGTPPPAAPDPAAADPTHLRIDLAPIRRELFREMAPNGSFDQMTPEERARVGREVNQRLLGIVQGIQLGAAELQRKAEAAKQQAAATSPAADAKASTVVRTRPVPAATPTAAVPVAPSAPPVTSVQPLAPAPPPAVKTSAPRPTASSRPEQPERPEPRERPEPPEPRERPEPPEQPEKPMTRKAALSGTQLNVRLERNGQIVQQVSAEINLPNLLATVFANTRRDSGEIPFAIGRDGHLYAPTDADRAKLATLDLSGVSDTADTKRVDDWIVVTMPDKSGAGLRFGIARPVGNLLTDLRRTTARNAGFGLLFIAIALGGMVPLSGRLTRNLTSLTDGVGRIAKGDYTARVPVKSQDEIGRLAAAFNSMAADVELHQHAAVEQERIRRELELGRRIQSEMLPHAPLQLGLSEVKGISMPAREVGGDFFNYFHLDSGLVALLVGDVSGKGVGAALLMANIQASLRTRFALGQDLSAIAEAVDRDIEANSPGPVYATLFIAIFDPKTRRMRYVNAGHNPQFVLRGDRRLEKMTSTGLPVGMLAGHGYGERAVQLEVGDLLFFYTDGCVEMENEAGEMFGSDRLESLVAASRGSADDVLMKVEQAISTFRGRRDLFDDATMMAVTVG